MRKRVNILITAVISVTLAALGATVFRTSYERLAETLRDLVRSVGYYFCELFGVPHSITPTVNELSEAAENIGSPLPGDFTGFCGKTSGYFGLLFSKPNFYGWINRTAEISVTAIKWFAIIFPCMAALWLSLKMLYGMSNEKQGKDTIPLRVFRIIAKYTYQPLKRTALGYAEFLRENGWIRACWITVCVLNLNLASIAVGFLAYYFYFSAALDFGTVYTQFVKLITDLKIPFEYFPWHSLMIAAYPLFHRFRKRLAVSRLQRYESRNCGFISELPIVSVTCGSMGKKKTTVITDMALSQESMFRRKAFSILQTGDLKFPQFPWLCFETELKKCIEYGTVYNLSGVKAWVNLKRARYMRHGNAGSQLYGYDVKRYGFTYDDGLKTSTVFDVLETYAQAYFIYVVESSLIVSNYAVRTDGRLLSFGNFPLWDTDFFPEVRRENSRFSHILDFDILRLGRKVIENNPKSGSFEFGVVVITEVGKERSNNLELKEVRKGSKETNQKNDLFNSWLKMCRHSATVDNYPFIKVFTDEQRPESWGADARELCEILNIAACGEERLALPFYTIEEMIVEAAFNKFINLYYDFRSRRGDNTLLVHVLKSITSRLWKRHIRLCNEYGYSVLKIEKERGTMDGRNEKKKYYVMNRKIYSRRFSTDCFSDYFHELSRRSGMGLNDYREYATERASVGELRLQNSYFINSLYGKEAGQDV